MPGLYILTGSNGAGKSTTGKYYLPDLVKNSYTAFDGDKLFMQKRKQVYKTITPSLKEAERIANQWLHEEFERQVSQAIDGNDHFVYEGHLPEEENWQTPKRFKLAGYSIHMIFLGLSNTSISELRVLERARLGGHNVPPYQIEKNFFGNLRQLNKQYPAIDELKIIDTSQYVPRVLAIFHLGKVIESLPYKDMPGWFAQGLPELYKMIRVQS